eukprot:PRCOL_00003901-RA
MSGMNFGDMYGANSAMHQNNVVMAATAAAMAAQAKGGDRAFPYRSMSAGAADYNYGAGSDRWGSRDGTPRRGGMRGNRRDRVPTSRGDSGRDMLGLVKDGGLGDDDGGWGQPKEDDSLKYGSLDEVVGRIYAIAKDQHGCRFLQRLFDEGDPAVIEVVFNEIIDHAEELMVDPFGNYLVQKLLECCSTEQRREVLERVAPSLVSISLNMHGTRAVQKLVETLEGDDQVELVVNSLKDGVVTLIKDLNGNHVVQRCLQKLSREQAQFIYDAAVADCVSIATHRHGCCVLQRCVDHAIDEQQERLAAEVAENSLVLSQDAFGNYVVQYILDLGNTSSSVAVMRNLQGSFAYLSMQKFSSNVVEKCLKLAPSAAREAIIRELAAAPTLPQMLNDAYANYVVQCALSTSKGQLYNVLCEAIRPHLAMLRLSPHGKRILAKLQRR